MTEFNNECMELCPKYALCQQIKDMGTAELMIGSFAEEGIDSLIEFETDDGRLVSGAEFFGLTEMDPEVVALHRAAGKNLRSAGRELGEILLNGCTSGPITAGGRYFCESRNRGAVDLAPEDVAIDPTSLAGAMVELIQGIKKRGNVMKDGQAPKGHEARVQSPAEYVAERRGWLREAVDLYHGPEVEGELTDLLPEPTQPRAEAPGWELSDEQEESLRAIARRFGLGAKEDLSSGADVELLEGGKPWKIASELAIASGAQSLIFAGTPHRITGPDEQSFMDIKHDGAVEGETEYDMIKRLIAGTEGFVPHEQPQDTGFGYDVENGHALVEGQTGQIVELGTINGKPVTLIRVDQVNLPDGKYEKRPNTLDLARITSAMLRAQGDDASSIGVVTSNSYASRAADPIIAGIKDGRHFAVGMYGRDTLAHVIEGVDAAKVPVETAINQIPSELYVIAERLDVLQAAIDEQA